MGGRNHALLAVMLGAALGGGDAVAADRPDVVILLTDQQRADAMSIAGTPGLHTPAMDGLARSGVRFTRAFAASPQCSPSRAALLTGLYPHRTGVMGNVDDPVRIRPGTSPPLAATVPSLGTIFAAAGYETAYFGKWHLGEVPGEHGFQVAKTDVQHHALTAQVKQFLGGRERRRPLLLVVSWINPHDIYRIALHRLQRGDVGDVAKVREPDSARDDLARKPRPQRLYRDDDQGRLFPGNRPDDWKYYRAYYYRLTESVDAELGEVLRALRARSPSALVVFSSDHGDLAGAHGMPFKGPMMYDDLIRVPLIIAWPPALKPSVSDALVSLVDVLPTLCDLAGVPAPKDVDGRSLRPLLEGGRGRPPGEREAIVAEYYGKQSWRVPIRMIRTRSEKYVRYLRDGEEFYDLGRDPSEMNNLAEDPAAAARKKALADRLDRWIEETVDPFPTLTVTDREGQPIAPDRDGEEKPAEAGRRDAAACGRP